MRKPLGTNGELMQTHREGLQRSDPKRSLVMWTTKVWPRNLGGCGYSVGEIQKDPWP